MSIVHEAICDGCGKREPARHPAGASEDLIWEMSEHPEGWFLVALTGNLGTIWRGKVQGYCSRRCVALGEMG